MGAIAQEKEFYTNGIPKDMKRKKFNMTINKRLKEARNKRGYSLAKVVQLLNERGVKTGVSTIQGYEANEDNINHRYPSQIMLLHLVNLYNCSIDYIFGLSNEIERPSKDLCHALTLQDEVLWKNEKISEGQKGLIIEKVNEIMSL
jgi:transcriptional regulator with XRE-family HTH domain